MADEKKQYILTSDHSCDRIVERGTGKVLEWPHGNAVVPKEKSEKAIGYEGGGFRGLIVYPGDRPEKPGLPYQLFTDGEFARMDEMVGKVCWRQWLENSYQGTDGDSSGTHYTWPHAATETAGLDPEVRQKFLDKLAVVLKDVPFEVKLQGFQRRYLLYFGPGSERSQTIYKTLAPVPRQSPFGAPGTPEEGKLSARYRDNFTPEKVNASLQATGLTGVPQAWSGMTVKPLLYRGPAWVVRFLLDDQDVLHGNRVWLTDDCEFISSDWCQRHDFSTYHRGMDYHAMEFDFPTWIQVGLVKKALGDRSFRPKHAEVKHFAVRDIMKAAAGGELGELARLAKDCLMQLEWLGKYETVEVDGVEYDPLRLAIKLPTNALIEGHGAFIHGPTIAKGQMVWWRWIDGAHEFPYFTPMAQAMNGSPWHSTITFDRADRRTADAFLARWNVEVARSRNGKIRGMPQKAFTHLIQVHRRDMDPAAYPLPAHPTIAAVWDGVFKIAKGVANIPLAGISESTVDTGRSDEGYGAPSVKHKEGEAVVIQHTLR